MKNIVFVPGIFGTKMIRADGYELWPPVEQGLPPDGVPLDVETRAAQITHPSTRPGALLERVVVFPTIDIPEYGPVADYLGNMKWSTLTRFPYDWRVDVRTTADALAQHLSTLGDDPVALVAHSMGGLICRYLIESGIYDGEPWFARIQQLICIATPHLGAPLTVFRLLGLEGMSGVFFPGRAMLVLAARPDTCPAGHQLLPPPTVACVQLPGGAKVDAAKAFPAIGAVGVAACIALHATLDRFSRPRSIEYHFAFGHGHANAGRLDTTVGITVDDRGRTEHVYGEGDGTVPFWSSLPATPAGFVTDQFGVTGDHVGILANLTLLQRLEDWLAPRIA